jgi:transcriptional regulator with XRE-family HTH domain
MPDASIPDPGPMSDGSARAHCDALGCAISRLRRARGLTIEDLASAAGMHTTYLSQIERGVCNPSWHKLCSLARALEVPLATLAQDAEDEAVLARILLAARARLSARRPAPGAAREGPGRNRRQSC